MKSNYLSILMVISVIHVTCQAGSSDEKSQEAAIHLLQDTGFQKGFIQQGNTISDVKRIPILTDSSRSAVWTLSQWYSDYVLTKEDLNILSSESYILENAANRISVAPEEGDIPVISIFSSGRLEWGEDSVRKQGDPWPHLLLSQKIDNCPPLNEVESIRFTADVRIKSWKINFPELYDPKIHASRFRLNFVVRNTNKGSEGFNDFFWFVMTFFDNRHMFSPGIMALDKGSEKKQASEKFIYGTDAKLYLNKSLHELEWVSIDLDILPFIKEGLIQAQKGGYLPESDSLKDYTIRGFNFGYELTANIDIESQVKNLSTVAVITKKLVTNNRNFPEKLKSMFNITQNFPNPVRFSTTISFNLPYRFNEQGLRIIDNRPVSINLYNLKGKKVLELLNSSMAPGEHNLRWRRPAGLPGGTYIYKIETGELISSRKMLILRL